MAYQVEFSARAERDTDDVVARIASDSIQNAVAWRERLRKKIEGFTLFPHGCSYANENGASSKEIRQAILGNHRIVFHIRESTNTIFIVTIRHAFQRDMAIGELERILSD